MAVLPGLCSVASPAGNVLTVQTVLGPLRRKKGCKLAPTFTLHLMSVTELISLNGIAGGLSRSRDSPLQHTLVLMYYVAQEGHRVTEKS